MNATIATSPLRLVLAGILALAAAYLLWICVTDPFPSNKLPQAFIACVALALALFAAFRRDGPMGLLSRRVAWALLAIAIMGLASLVVLMQIIV